ncbi:MAG: ABC transporter ATP-binding protein/permease, partial [Defluviitaleaceae bacterium]|nr:ABC transporter ATP-binding protein/permease [Defluviitaleaceae bacterium]
MSQIFVGEMGQAAYQFDTSAILRFLLVLTAIMGIRAIFSASSALFLGRFSGSVGYKFRVNFAKFFLHQPFARLEKANSGENLSIFTTDLPQAVLLVSSGALQMVSDFMLLIVVAVYMFYMNWLYTLIFIASFPVLAIVQVIISAPIQKTAKKASEASAKFNAVVNDSLQNTATIIAYSLEEELESRYISAYKEFFKAAMQRIRFFSTIVLAGFIFSTLPIVFIFIASGFAVVNGTMLISDFIAFTGIGMMAASWLMNLSQSLGNVKTWMAGAIRLNESITGEFENIGNRQRLAVTEKSAIVFDDISFTYTEDTPNVLHNISFEIPHGKKVAIIGGSGSGKSTILKLILGLYEPK